MSAFNLPKYRIMAAYFVAIPPEASILAFKNVSSKAETASCTLSCPPVSKITLDGLYTSIVCVCVYDVYRTIYSTNLILPE